MKPAELLGALVASETGYEVHHDARLAIVAVMLFSNELPYGSSALVDHIDAQYGVTLQEEEVGRMLSLIGEWQDMAEDEHDAYQRALSATAEEGTDESHYGVEIPCDHRCGCAAWYDKEAKGYMRLLLTWVREQGR